MNRDDNIRPLPVEHPYCAICLHFQWEEVKRVYWKDVQETTGHKPASCFNRYVPMGRCLSRDKTVSAFATCDNWQDDA